MTAFERRLLAVVTTLWGDAAREKVAIPVLADLHYELAQQPAIAGRRLWVSVRGMGALLSALLLYGIRPEGTAVRFGTTCLATTAAVAVLDATLTLTSSSDTARTLTPWMYLLPPAIPIAVTAGVGVGLARLQSRRRTDPHVRRTLVTTIVLVTALIAVATNHAIPDSNQRFREHVYSMDGRAPARGANELSWAQLVHLASMTTSDASSEHAAYPPAPFWLAARLEVTLAPLTMLLLLRATKRRDSEGARTGPVFLTGATTYVIWHLLTPPSMLAEVIQYGASPWIIASTPMLLVSAMGILVALASRRSPRAAAAS